MVSPFMRALDVNILDTLIINHMSKGIIPDNLRVNEAGLKKLQQYFSDWLFYSNDKIFYRSLEVTVDNEISSDTAVLVAGRMAW